MPLEKKKTTNRVVMRGKHSTTDSVLTSHPAAPGSILSLGILLRNEDSGGLIIMNETHLALTSGKLVQKNTEYRSPKAIMS